MAVYHVKSNTVADQSNSGQVRPSDWNSAHNQVFLLSGNTSGSSVVSGTDVVLQAAGNLTLVGTGATVQISGSNNANTLSLHVPVFGSFGTGQIGQNSVQFSPLYINANLSFDRVVQAVTVSQSTSSNSSYSIAIDMHVGVYSRSGSTLFLASSGSVAHQWSITSNDTTANQNGGRYLTAPLSANLSIGDWWMGIMSNTRTTNANWATISQYFISQAAANMSGQLAQVATATAQFVLGSGTYSTTTSALPGSVAFTQIHGNVRTQPFFAVQNGTA